MCKDGLLDTLAALKNSSVALPVALLEVGVQACFFQNSHFFRQRFLQTKRGFRQWFAEQFDPKAKLGASGAHRLAKEVALAPRWQNHGGDNFKVHAPQDLVKRKACDGEGLWTDSWRVILLFSSVF